MLWSGVRTALVAAVAGGTACSDDGSPTDSGDPASGHVCEVWGRAIPGAIWTYESYPDPTDPTWVNVVTYFGAEYDPATGKFHLDWEKLTTSSSSDAVQDGRLQYRCDEDGMWIEGSEYVTVITYTDGTTSEDRSTDTYTEPQLLLPATFGDGAEWTSKGHWERASSKFGPSSGDVNRSCVPVGLEELTVPAGTFEAARVECTEHGSVDAVPSWYAAEVGLLKFAEVQELVDFAP